MKNLGWYIFTIFMGLLILSVTNTNLIYPRISYGGSIFEYNGIFMIILGLWGILSGILHKEDNWILTFVLIVFVTISVVLALSHLGI